MLRRRIGAVEPKLDSRFHPRFFSSPISGIAPSELTPALVAAFEREAAVAAATAARRPVAVGLSWDE